MAFKLSSDDFKDGDTLPEAQVFNGMGHQGGNHLPAAGLVDAPAGTKSFVVTLYDPDAPTGSGWWHWVVANIPALRPQLAARLRAAAGRPAARRGAGAHRLRHARATAVPHLHPGRRIAISSRVHALKVDHIDVDQRTAAAPRSGFMTHMNSLGSAIAHGALRRASDRAGVG